MARKTAPIDPTAARLDATLGTALARAGLSLSRQAIAPSAAPAPAAPAPGDAIPALGERGKIVLRRERKGRGGKTATVVSGLGLSSSQLDAVARALRKALGCGATVEGADIVLQGDMTTRAQTWLAQRGARQIVIGN